MTVFTSKMDGKSDKKSWHVKMKLNVKNINTDGSIINKRYTKDVSYGRLNGIDNKVRIGESSNIEASNTLNIDAKDKVVVQGSELNAKDININASSVEIASTVDKKDFFGGNSKNYVKEKSTTHLASNINTDNINISASESAKIKGSNLNAANNLNIKAKKIDILAVNDSSYIEKKSSSSGFMSSSTTLD
ncbi:hemagglutinin repeat-containing protein, partial [Sulfurimonas sp.]|uniref:hemagglutinin repeat-containing protein n=1 Tax=Sulfurimonas sp. TaxID=2022749 RepID=UPI00356361E0